jgi:hypothetical protein
MIFHFYLAISLAFIEGVNKDRKMTMRPRHLVTALLMSFGLAMPLAGTALADEHRNKPWDKHNYGGNDNRGLEARPFVFVGTAKECGGPAGSNIVTSAWLRGMGLPDSGAANPSTNKRDRQLGLLLNKNGPTSNCSAAGATINGFRSGTPLTELGFDYRIGGHCGAGAPRFNLTSTAGFTYFAGCAGGTPTPAPQDPSEWTRVRFTAAGIFPASPSAPPFVLGVGGTPVKGIAIIFDEGNDTPSPSDPTGVGLAVLDNIDINGKVIAAGRGVAP